MNDYRKWDKIADSDEEEEKAQQVCRSYQDEAAEDRRKLQSEIDSFLRRQISKLPRDGDPNTNRLRESMPELAAKGQPTPVRVVTKSEREVMSMLIAMSYFEEGSTNLERHAMILELVRHHRWLQDDPGSMELLCRIHNNVMKDNSEGGSGRQAREFEDPEQRRMRDMVLCGINTLAAPQRAKCAGGLIELFTQICTPENDTQREMRKKWQQKGYGQDAVFDSLFPNLREYTEDTDDEEGMGSEFWIMLLLGLLAIIGICAFMFMYSNGIMDTSSRKVKVRGNLSNASVVSAGPPAVSKASSVAPAPAPPAAKLACTDIDEGCAYWAQIGECTSNAEFMLSTCRLSCNVCKVAAPSGAPPSSPGSAAASAADAREGEL